jgi:hypothetical protein
MTRSLPEKTFEHWCSIHLNYRYRSHLQMWWPTTGADVEAIRIPGAFGKRIWLELKSVEWTAAAARHDLEINLRQLNAYGAQSIPDYYVFPVPKWQGVIGDSTSAVWLGTLPRPLLAYQTRSKEKWFADWTYVVPGHVLRRRLALQIAAWLSTGKGETLRIAEVTSGALTWVPSALAGVEPMLWKSFWSLIEACGSAEFPAQFVVPNRPISGSRPSDGGPDGSPSVGPTIPKSSLVAELRLLAEDSKRQKAESKGKAAEELPNAYLYEQVAEDNYQLSAAEGAGVGSGFVWDATRALILLEAGALRI